MRHAIIGSICLTLILFVGSVGLTATSHPLDVYFVDDYASVSINGTASTTITVADFNSGLTEKQLTSNVTIKLHSQRMSCSVLVSGPNFGAGFPVNQLQLWINSPGETYHNLATTPVLVGSYPNQPNKTYPVSFKLIGIQRLDQLEPKLYTTTITYTVVTPAL